MNIKALTPQNKIKIVHRLLTYLISSVWLANGLFCKVLNMVPRHQQIVVSILGYHYASVLTMSIGIAEVMMAVWIVSGIKSRLNTIIQIFIICSMNILEFFLAPGLLLWGRFNLLFALLFSFLIYWNEYVLHKKAIQQT